MKEKKSLTVAELEETCLLFFETREHELDNLPNSNLIMKYYTMALEDVYHYLTGKRLKFAQDVDDIDWNDDEFEDLF